MPLKPILTDFPFSKWGLEFIGPINPSSPAGHIFILTATNYFTKWDEAMPTVKYDGNTTSFFVFNQIIFRFGILSEIVIDHGSHF